MKIVMKNAYKYVTFLCVVVIGLTQVTMSQAMMGWWKKSKAGAEAGGEQPLVGAGAVGPVAAHGDGVVPGVMPGVVPGVMPDAVADSEVKEARDGVDGVGVRMPAGVDGGRVRERAGAPARNAGMPAQNKWGFFERCAAAFGTAAAKVASERFEPAVEKAIHAVEQRAQQKIDQAHGLMGEQVGEAGKTFLNKTNGLVASGTVACTLLMVYICQLIWDQFKGKKGIRSIDDIVSLIRDGRLDRPHYGGGRKKQSMSAQRRARVMRAMRVPSRNVHQRRSVARALNGKRPARQRYAAAAA